MPWIVQNLWLIPALPLVAAALIAVVKRPRRRLAATLAIGTMGLSCLLSLCAFAHALLGIRKRRAAGFQFPLVPVGRRNGLQLGWVLDPLAAIMLRDGLLGGPADLHLQRGLHGARRELHAVLLFPVLVRRRDARAGHRQQPAAAFHLLGIGRADLLPADWLLVSQTQRGRGGEKGVHHHAHRRPRLFCSACSGSIAQARHAAFL